MITAAACQRPLLISLQKEAMPLPGSLRCAHTSQSGFPVAKQEPIKRTGTVTRVMPNNRYRVELDNGFTVLGFTSGKMRKYNIRILQGDQVDIEMSPYDLSKGRIVYRHKT